VTSQVIYLSVQRVHPDPRNPREDIGDLTELAASLNAVGMLQPVLVVPHPVRPGDWMLRTGERRWRAARVAGHQQIPGIALPPSAAALPPKILALIENCHRKALKPMERAEAIGALIKDGHTEAQIAHMSGFSPSTISFHVSLLLLDEPTRELVRSGKLTATAAVRHVREARKNSGVGKGRGKRPARVSVEPDHFSAAHPLSRQARALCTSQGHTARKIGAVACGACWESVIRDDALAGSRVLRDAS
jgi:ParB family chromosome partitioning protein